MKIEKIKDGFSLLPRVDLLWIYDYKNHKRIYDIQIAWLFWYVLTTNFKKILEYSKKY